MANSSETSVWRLKISGPATSGKFNVHVIKDETIVGYVVLTQEEYDLLSKTLAAGGLKIYRTKLPPGSAAAPI